MADNAKHRNHRQIPPDISLMTSGVFLGIISRQLCPFRPLDIDPVAHFSNQQRHLITSIQFAEFGTTAIFITTGPFTHRLFTRLFVIGLWRLNGTSKFEERQLGQHCGEEVADKIASCGAWIISCTNNGCDEGP